VATVASIRRYLLAVLALGVAGTAGELLLLGHFESVSQWIPLALLAVAIPVLIWHAVSPAPVTVQALRLLMAAFVISGGVGIGFHLSGNVEFERELHPDEYGFTLLRKTLVGATPVLAPGSMVLLGLIGLVHAYRHPLIEGDGGERPEGD
jgi:hypothetical protein